MKRAKANLSIYQQTKTLPNTQQQNADCLCSGASAPCLNIVLSPTSTEFHSFFFSYSSSLSIGDLLRQRSARSPFVYTQSLFWRWIVDWNSFEIYPTIGSLRSFCFALVFDGFEFLLCVAAFFLLFSGLACSLFLAALYTHCREIKNVKGGSDGVAEEACWIV